MGEETQVLLELERLRGAVNEGFARVGGRLDGALQLQENTIKDVDELKSATDRRMDEFQRRIGSLERKVWIAAGAAAVAGGTAAGGLWNLIH